MNTAAVAAISGVGQWHWKQKRVRQRDSWLTTNTVFSICFCSRKLQWPVSSASAVVEQAVQAGLNDCFANVERQWHTVCLIVCQFLTLDDITTTTTTTTTSMAVSGTRKKQAVIRRVTANKKRPTQEWQEPVSQTWFVCSSVSVPFPMHLKKEISAPFQADQWSSMGGLAGLQLCVCALPVHYYVTSANIVHSLTLSLFFTCKTVPRFLPSQCRRACARNYERKYLNWQLPVWTRNSLSKCVCRKFGVTFFTWLGKNSSFSTLNAPIDLRWGKTKVYCKMDFSCFYPKCCATLMRDFVCRQAQSQSHYCHGNTNDSLSAIRGKLFAFQWLIALPLIWNVFNPILSFHNKNW